MSAPSPPALAEAPLAHPSCSWLEGSESCGGKPGHIWYSMFLNVSLGNICAMILIYLRLTATYATERACRHPIYLMGQGDGALLHSPSALLRLSVHTEETISRELKKKTSSKKGTCSSLMMNIALVTKHGSIIFLLTGFLQHGLGSY